MSAIDVFAYFRLPESPRGPGFDENGLKAIVERLKAVLIARGFEAGELFGSATDLWAFSVDMENSRIDVGLSPESSSADEWSAQCHLDDPGFFKSTRTLRLTELNRVEWAVHEVLTGAFGAENLEWFTGRIRRGHGQPTPTADRAF